MLTLNIKPISEAPKGTWDKHIFKPDWILVMGGKNRSSEMVNTTYSYWIPKEERWNGYAKDHPPKWFVDMKQITAFLE